MSGFFVDCQMNFRGLFDIKAIIVENLLWYYLTHSWENQGLHFSQGDSSEREPNGATEN